MRRRMHCVAARLSSEPISIVDGYGNERIVPGRYALHLGDYHGDNYVRAQFQLVQWLRLGIGWLCVINAQ